eukprot:8868577-Prorocentrum_lima.AAC.1
MTSSLVGSEMCIRDRIMRLQHGRQRKKRKAATTKKATTWEAENGATTVSYTHLTLPTICSV